MTPLLPYLHLAQGQGGLFELPFSDVKQKTTRIGTHSCVTCVCVYIPISNTKCFAAHIDSHVFRVDDLTDRASFDAKWIPTNAQGEALTAFVAKTLHDRVPDLANASRASRESIVICPCRTMDYNGLTRRTTGSYIVEAVNEYFHLHDQRTDAVSRTAHGFVVDIASGKTYFLKVTTASEEQLRRFDMLSSIPDADRANADVQAIEALTTSIKPEEVREKGFGEVRWGGKIEWTFELGPDG